MWKSERFVETVFKKKKEKCFWAQWLFSALQPSWENFFHPPLLSFFTQAPTEMFREAKKNFFFFYVRKRHSWVYKSITAPGNPLRTPFTFCSCQRWSGGGVNSAPQRPDTDSPLRGDPWPSVEVLRLFFFIIYSNLWSSIKTLLPEMVGSAKGPSFRPSTHLRPGRSCAGETPPSPSPRFSSSPALVIKRWQLRDRGLRKMMKRFSWLSEFVWFLSCFHTTRENAHTQWATVLRIKADGLPLVRRSSSVTVRCICNKLLKQNRLRCIPPCIEQSLAQTSRSFKK